MSSPSELTAEEIRNRRLRRLGALAPTSTAEPSAQDASASPQKPSSANNVNTDAAGDDSTNANSVVRTASAAENEENSVTVDNNKNHHHNHQHSLRLAQEKASGSKRKSSDLDQCPDGSKNSNSVVGQKAFLPAGVSKLEGANNNQEGSGVDEKQQNQEVEGTQVLLPFDHIHCQSGKDTDQETRQLCVNFGITDDEDVQETLTQGSTVLHLPTCFMVLPFAQWVMYGQRRLDGDAHLLIATELPSQVLCPIDDLPFAVVI